MIRGRQVQAEEDTNSAQLMGHAMVQYRNSSILTIVTCFGYASSRRLSYASDVFLYYKFYHSSSALTPLCTPTVMRFFRGRALNIQIYRPRQTNLHGASLKPTGLANESYIPNVFNQKWSCLRTIGSTNLRKLGRSARARSRFILTSVPCPQWRPYASASLLFETLRSTDAHIHTTMFVDWWLATLASILKG